MRTIAIIVALAIGAGGCAIAGAKAPGRVSLQARPDCNSGKGGVVADGLAAALLGVAAIAAASAEEGGPAAGLGLVSLAFIGSAISGSTSANKCRAAHDEYNGLLEARLGELGSDRAAAAAARADATSDEVAPPVAATTVATPPTPPRPTPPVMAMRPTTPPKAPTPSPTAPSPDDDDDDAAADDSDDTDDPHGWTEFWREVKP